MTIRVAHTLEFMADIYRRSTAGGANSDRFQTFVKAAPSLPVQGYNPIASKPRPRHCRAAHRGTSRGQAGYTPAGLDD